MGFSMCSMPVRQASKEGICTYVLVQDIQPLTALTWFKMYITYIPYILCFHTQHQILCSLTPGPSHWQSLAPGSPWKDFLLDAANSLISTERLGIGENWAPNMESSQKSEATFESLGFKTPWCPRSVLPNPYTWIAMTSLPHRRAPRGSSSMHTTNREIPKWKVLFMCKNYGDLWVLRNT